MSFLKNLLIVVFIIVSFVFLFMFPYEVSISISKTLSLWITKVVPTLFPIFVFTEIIINYNIASKIGHLFHKPFRVLFNSQNTETSCSIFLSFLTGTPGSSKLINSLYETQSIDETYANYLVRNFSSMNPIFILGTVGALTFKDINAATTILFVHIIVTIVFGFFNKPKLRSIHTFKTEKKYNSFTNVIINATQVSISVLLNILGLMLFFSVIIHMITTSELLPRDYIGFIELTSGLDKVLLNNSYKTIVAFTSSMIYFLGLCIHVQMISIIKFRFNYLIFILQKGLMCIVIFLLTYILI